ncbi:MAG: NADH-quinone oxidoreductase subunit A [Candidatus Aminicenantales bacterium]
MTLALVFLVFGLLGVLMVSMNAILGPKKTNPAKEKPFECGSPPLQKGIPGFAIKFPLVVFLFVLFDIEIAFLFPWALVFREMKGPALLILLAYVAVLGAGFAYAWRKGAFRWE